MATDSTTAPEPLLDLKAGGDALLVAKLAETVERLESEEAPPLVAALDTSTNTAVVLLHQSGQCAALPSFQSECLTVCTWLRAANVPFKTMNHKLVLTGSRFPMVELGDDEFGPSDNILEKLSRRLNCNLDEALSPDQKILSYAMASTVEHTLGAAHRRWCNENRGQLLRAYDLDLKRALKRSAMPRGVLEFFFRRSASRNEKSRGQPEDERLKAVRMISEFLGDRPFCFAEAVTTLDVVAFGVLAPMLAVSGNVAYPLRDQMILNYPNLVGFVERVKQRLFPDWVDLCCGGGGSASEDGKCAVDKKHKLELDHLNSGKERKQQQPQSDKVLENSEAELETQV
ncbi:failed axon connections [Culex quinquefasciatus]|uniref:failed axon connections n=1 Tax=Culex quinquefasciatus TaxID=7176 RepID=UPI0018E2A07C|nr:failed axon connections [Culex quinquefasciatus]